MRTRLLAWTLAVLCLSIIFINTSTSHAALGDPCSDDAGCDLCAGEACSQGQCVFNGGLPCKLQCQTCQQNGDQTSCLENDAFCAEFSVECSAAVCDDTEIWYLNPTGCDFVHNDSEPACNACGICGNGICEAPETPKTCLADCLSENAWIGTTQDPSSSCGAPLDLPGGPVTTCNDGNVCTDDICQSIAQLQEAQEEGVPLISGICQYPAKACSGAVQDFCCPQSCTGDPSSQGYDIDCCPPVIPSPSPSPSPTPSPGATPEATPESTPPAFSPNPQETGDNTPGGTVPPNLSIFGGGCQLSPVTGGKSYWQFIVGVALLELLRRRRERN